MEGLCPRMKHYGIMTLNGEKMVKKVNSVDSNTVVIDGTMTFGGAQYDHEQRDLMIFCDRIVEIHEEKLTAAIQNHERKKISADDMYTRREVSQDASLRNELCVEIEPVCPGKISNKQWNKTSTKISTLHVAPKLKKFVRKGQISAMNKLAKEFMKATKKKGRGMVNAAEEQEDVIKQAEEQRDKIVNKDVSKRSLKKTE